MKKLLLFPAAIFLMLMSCQKQFDEIDNVQSRDLKKNYEVSETLVKSVAGSLFSGDDSEETRSSEAIEYDIEPIFWKDKLIFWVINYASGGHVILSADKRCHPIASFNLEESFNYNLLDSVSKISFDMKLSRYYDSYATTDIENETEIWSIIEQNDQTRSDTLTTVSVNFSFDKTIGANEPVDRMSPSTRSTNTGGIGTVPERTTPLGYSTVYPLLSMYGRRNWTVFMPYCYDMPVAYGGGESQSGYGPYWHSGMTICLALVMDYMLTPSVFFWFSQPKEQTIRASTPLTQFLRELSDDIGYKVGYTSGGNLPWSNIQSLIPAKMADKYYLNMTCIPYSANQTGLNQIKNNLYQYNPIILSTKGNTSYPLLGSNSFFIIDGIAELKTTVTIKKKFLGITLKTTVNTYYMDYLHYVSTVGSQYDEWELYDSNSTSIDDLIYLIRY